MLFWGETLQKKRHASLRELPSIPDLGWKPPTYFPNLSDATVISFDTETKELDFDNGPGWSRGKGHIVGVSVGAEDRRGNRGSWYFPLRHEVGGEYNMDTRQVFAWLKETLQNTPHIPKVGANLTYDVGWLAEEGIFVSGELNDVQFAEALIDNEARVALEVLSRKYLGYGKYSDDMYDWMRAAYPNTPETKRRGDIYRTPPQIVGFYAESDANNPIDILKRQAPILRAEGLEYVYRLECDLIPLMVAMRRQGIRVDVGLAEQLLEEIKRETAGLYDALQREYGFAPETMDSRQLGPFLARLGIDVPRTEPSEKNPDGNLSVVKQWLADLDHPVGDALNDIREHEKIAGTFLQGYVIDKNVNGILHPQFHQLKGDANGTLVGRFASSDPNLQNIPSRTKLGKKVRTCFKPFEGHSHYQKNDYSQIHYRILAHFGVGPGSEELRNSYITNPKMDYHDNVYYNVCPLMGWDAADEELKDFRRRPIKNVNFGLLYGQAEKSLGAKTAMYFGGSFDVAGFFKAYFEGAPYIKPTMKNIAEEVQRYGYVTTILGRRIRFHLWEPAGYGRKGEPLPYDQALRVYGSPLRRAFEYRGVNYKFQGSEPDIMKEGMRRCWQSGVYDFTGVPLLTVHDETGHSVIEGEAYQGVDKKGNPVTKYRASKQQQEAYDFIRYTMEHSVKLRVPLRVDTDTGLNWGACG